ncbi:phosphoribosyltransferase [Solimicrobium silvestre]|uniref:Putative phosphoribosyltransferase n=1 Tax=Solimicrobium silvestre TaxID=2099400 RepID=A0A2S9GW11_9BURK|nr:phosphoribosyltransferase [Solimicrobium silvestre]PRC91904.1 putative phosphoribosyltransferase [Solimicrobium silvestre]
MSLSDTTDGHLWVSWDEYHRLIEKLALRVYESGWEFDQILCLARGGLRPGDVLSRIFNVPLAILSTSSYRAESGTQQGVLDIAKHITMTSGSLAGRVLVVDDLVDTGVTLQAVTAHLTEHFRAVTEVKSAVIWQKAASSIVPDYAIEYLVGNPWIHQPFEDYDGLRPDQLLMRVQKHHG